MILNNVCAPALIYIAFSITHIAIEMLRMNYNTAFVKFIVMIVFTILLNILCSRGLTVISWFLVMMPFIIMTFMTTILVFTFGTSFISEGRGEADGSTYSLKYY